MEPVCLTDDAEFWLPPEFLTDDDFLVEKGKKESNKCSWEYDPSPGFGLDSSFGDEESFLAGLTQKMVQDDFSGGNHAFPAKAWGVTRSPQASLCQTRVSSQAAAAWDMYCAAAEELAMMNINGYNNNHSYRGLLDLPRKQPLAAAKIPNDGSGFYSRQSLQYQKLQAIHFQQLKQQQLMKHRLRLAQQSNNNKMAGLVDSWSPHAWSNHPQRRDGSGMRAVFLGNQTEKRGSTGTGVFLPRSANQTSPVTAEPRKKPTLSTVLVPDRMVHVRNLDESVGHHPSVRSSASLNDVTWRQRNNNGGYSSQMKLENAVNEPRLPSDWAY